MAKKKKDDLGGNKLDSGKLRYDLMPVRVM